MGQRGRPRHLYDIVNLFRRNDLRMHAAVIRDVLVEKYEAKGELVYAHPNWPQTALNLAGFLSRSAVNSQSRVGSAPSRRRDATRG